jgi:mono/diheme cytochrome c family protein
MRCKPVVLVAILLFVSLPVACSDQDRLQHGAGIYAAHCAQCHGRDLEGEPEWQRRRPDGRLPAPPHDASGHTWHHPDSMLFAITKYGMVPPYAPEGYPSDMPAFKGILTDAEITDVLEFIKSRWPRREREYQAALTRQHD